MSHGAWMIIHSTSEIGGMWLIRRTVPPAFGCSCWEYHEQLKVAIREEGLVFGLRRCESITCYRTCMLAL